MTAGNALPQKQRGECFAFRGIGAAAVCLLTVEDFLRYTILLGIKCASQGRASTFFVINDVRQVQIWQNPRQNSNMAMTPSPP